MHHDHAGAHVIDRIDALTHSSLLTAVLRLLLRVPRAPVVQCTPTKCAVASCSSMWSSCCAKLHSLLVLWLLAAAVWQSCPPVGACTTLVVGKDASADGSVMCSHSNDGAASSGGRIMRIAAADWPPGSNRTVAGGSIPQVAHTYGYHTEGCECHDLWTILVAKSLLPDVGDKCGAHTSSFTSVERWRTACPPTQTAS